ncbi:hypothetical protein AGMMS50296_0730 [Alphaproteobacteria bacterium]|nr:hypothetical protein AGMMS50296_0730 [Alphaproteobacteria bacterium]
MIRKGAVTIHVCGQVRVDRGDWGKTWLGSGFIVDLKKGLIVTNAHVAGEMKAVCTYEIKYGNGTKTDAKLEYIDPCYDIAILSVDPKVLPQDSIALELSEKDVSVNTDVFAMGSTWGNEFSTYPGTVFDTNSILGMRPFPEQSFQFSGLTTGGASGSPVFTSEGKVVGLLYGGKFVSGAALPIKYVQPIIKSLQNGERIKRYFCGFTMDYIDIQDAAKTDLVPKDFAENYSKKFKEANNKVLYVSKTLAAFKEGETDGVEAGDVLVKVNDVDIGDQLQKFDDLMQKSGGEKVKAKVYRNGSLVDVFIYPKLLEDFYNMKILSFSGAALFETNSDIRVEKGEKKTAVYIGGTDSDSLFKDISGKISMIDGKKISTLEDVVALIPDLLKKEFIKISYIVPGSDGQEMAKITRHIPKFCQEGEKWEYENEKKDWKKEKIVNPAQ